MLPQSESSGAGGGLAGQLADKKAEMMGAAQELKNTKKINFLLQFFT